MKTIIRRSPLSQPKCNVQLKIQYVNQYGNKHELGEHENGQVLVFKKMTKKTWLINFR